MRLPAASKSTVSEFLTRRRRRKIRKAGRWRTGLSVAILSQLAWCGWPRLITAAVSTAATSDRYLRLRSVTTSDPFFAFELMDRPSLACAAAISTGLAVSSAHPLGMLAAIAMPAVVMCQLKCRVAYSTAVCYYAGALWPLIPGARNFFGASVPLVSALALWAVASTLL